MSGGIHNAQSALNLNQNDIEKTNKIRLITHKKGTTSSLP